MRDLINLIENTQTPNPLQDAYEEFKALPPLERYRLIDQTPYDTDGAQRVRNAVKLLINP